MKSLLLLTLMAISFVMESPEAELRNDQGLNMQLSEIVFQEMVKVYDYEGNLLREFQLTDVVNNNITIDDHVLLEQSDFAFDYLGDYYYFSEDEFEETFN
ncbi:MAG: hypothetical protein AAF391_09665 [Bacteroidota bacterium]